MGNTEKPSGVTVRKLYVLRRELELSSEVPDWEFLAEAEK